LPKTFFPVRLNIMRRISGTRRKKSKEPVGIGVGVVLVIAVGCSRVWRFVMDRSSAKAVARLELQSGFLGPTLV
jgi:hypothetical protein